MLISQRKLLLTTYIPKRLQRDLHNNTFKVTQHLVQPKTWERLTKVSAIHFQQSFSQTYLWDCREISATALRKICTNECSLKSYKSHSRRVTCALSTMFLTHINVQFRGERYHTYNVFIASVLCNNTCREFAWMEHQELWEDRVKVALSLSNSSGRTRGVYKGQVNYFP